MAHIGRRDGLKQLTLVGNYNNCFNVCALLCNLVFRYAFRQQQVTRHFAIILKEAHAVGGAAVNFRVWLNLFVRCSAAYVHIVPVHTRLLQLFDNVARYILINGATHGTIDTGGVRVDKEVARLHRINFNDGAIHFLHAHFLHVAFHQRTRGRLILFHFLHNHFANAGAVDGSINKHFSHRGANACSSKVFVKLAPEVRNVCRLLVVNVVLDVKDFTAPKGGLFDFCNARLNSLGRSGSNELRPLRVTHHILWRPDATIDAHKLFMPCAVVAFVVITPFVAAAQHPLSQVLVWAELCFL